MSGPGMGGGGPSWLEDLKAKAAEAEAPADTSVVNQGDNAAPTGDPEPTGDAGPSANLDSRLADVLEGQQRQIESLMSATPAPAPAEPEAAFYESFRFSPPEGVTVDDDTQKLMDAFGRQALKAGADAYEQGQRVAAERFAQQRAEEARISKEVSDAWNESYSHLNDVDPAFSQLVSAELANDPQFSSLPPRLQVKAYGDRLNALVEKFTPSANLTPGQGSPTATTSHRTSVPQGGGVRTGGAQGANPGQSSKSRIMESLLRTR